MHPGISILCRWCMQRLNFKMIWLSSENPVFHSVCLGTAVLTYGFKCVHSGDRSDFPRGSTGDIGKGIFLQFLLEASCSQSLDWDADLLLPATQGRILNLSLEPCSHIPFLGSDA